MNLLLAIFFSSIVSAQNNSNIEITFGDPAPYRPDLIDQVAIHQDQKGLFSRYPSGAADLPIDPKCSPENLEKQIIDAIKTNKSKPDVLLKKYFANCGSHISHLSPKGIFSLVDFYLVKYDVFANSAIKAMTLKLADGSKINGFLALKDDDRKRPLFIIRCGLFCTGAPAASTINYVMNFFDQSPFHVLVLASNSGLDQVIDNKRLLIGGYSEAIESVKIAQWVRLDSPMKDKISSVHFMGMSLGGSTALFSSYYNDRYENFFSEKPLNSVMALCPVVQLDKSIRHVLSNSLLGGFLSEDAWGSLVEARPYLPEVHDLYAADQRPDNTELSDIVGEASTRYWIQYRNQNFFPPYVFDQINNLKDFWNANNFLKQASVINTPTFVWGSKDDIVVSNSVNAGELERTKIHTQNPDYNVLNVSYGSHCAFQSAYGFLPTTSILRGFVLGNSPEFQQTQNYSPLSYKFKPFQSEKMHINQTWYAQKGKDYFIVSFQSFRKYSFGENDNCWDEYAYESKEQCIDTDDKKVPFKSLPFKVKVPATKAEAQALTRWANGNLIITNDKGANITGTASTPMGLKWYEP